MSFCVKLTGEDLSCYSIKIESLGLRKLLLAPAWQSDCMCCSMFTFPCPNNMAARTASIDENVEITSLSAGRVCTLKVTYISVRRKYSRRSPRCPIAAGNH